MTYQALKEFLISIATHEHDVERYYRLSADKVFGIIVELFPARRMRRLRMKQGTEIPKPSITCLITTAGGAWIEWEDLTPTELRNVAICREHLDNWIAGKIAELPPSDVEKPTRVESDE